MSEIANIRGFHAHDAATRPTAERIRGELARRFPVELGRMHDKPIGPHPKPMFEVDLAPEQFASVVPWLMIHREGSSVLPADGRRRSGSRDAPFVDGRLAPARRRRRAPPRRAQTVTTRWPDRRVAGSPPWSDRPTSIPSPALRGPVGTPRATFA
jgi:aromatic ring-cleaving dioxygenase